MQLNDISGQVVDAALQAHRALGPGLLESVYEIVLAHELRQRGLEVERQMAVPIRYRDITFDEGFRADLVVERRVLVELKSVSELTDVHKKQVLTYLRLMDLRLGLLINFNVSLLKDGIVRIANDLRE
ncbi:MAG: GxxExxY protein [Planctomycetota bacterium]|nr:MAG: GxxExxY protein [Planctomycetota bacterium]